MTETSDIKPKTCQACGLAFGCGVDASTCWCSEVSVSAHVLERLRASFEDCLCPECLAKQASKSEAPAT